MEYFGFFYKRNVDYKRRILFPSQWKSDQKVFFWVGRHHEDEDDILGRIYPESEWNTIKNQFEDKKEREEFFSRSCKLKLDSYNRLLLPKTCISNMVDMDGCVDYIIIRSC
jgi:DNA-binding transcriptional regulator/RsmH inhibitor MraZ